MKIKRNKWHFKLYTFWRQCWDDTFNFFELVTRRQSLRLGYYKPKSLCTYFWSTVFLSTLAAFALIVFNVGLLILIAGCYAITIPYDAWRDRHPKVESDKEPGLLRSFVKAKKAKLCPLIEIVD